MASRSLSVALVAIAATMLGPAGADGTTAAPPVAPVRTYQADFGHSGAASTTSPTLPLTPLWTARTYDMSSAPVVAGGTVYVGSYDAVTAFDLATGTKRWTRTLGQVAGVDVAAGLVHVVTDDCLVLALDPATGDTRWIRAIPGGYEGQCVAPPVTRAGATYVVASFSPQRLVALDAESGAFRWRRGIQYAGYSAPLVLSDRVVVSGLLSSRAFGLDGTALWVDRCCSAEEGAGRPAVAAGGIVYAGAGGPVLDATDGRHLGAHLPPGRFLAVAQGKVVVLADDGITVIDAVTRQVEWTSPLSAAMVPPLVVGGSVFVQESDGTLHALALTDGAEQWSTQLESVSAWSHRGFALAGHTLLVPGRGRLHAFDTGTTG